MNAISTIYRFIVGNVIIYSNIFPPLSFFLFFYSFHYEKKKNSQVKDNIHRKEREREGDRLTLSALANANFLFPARLQWDTLHACFCFDNLLLSLSLSLSAIIMRESLIF